MDFVKYFGRGETQSKANNVCAAKVLAAFESGEHERSTEALYKDAFKKLGEMHSNLLYRTLTPDADKCEVDADKCVVCVNVSLEHNSAIQLRSTDVNAVIVYHLSQVESVDYFGEGQTICEAKNDAAWAALKSVWSGLHQKEINEMDEYWYDDDDFTSNFSCNCDCHSCGCCKE